MKELTPLEVKQIEEAVKPVLTSKDFTDVDFVKCVQTFGRDSVMAIYKRMREQSGSVWCHLCSDTGLVTARRGAAEFIFRCTNCKKAEWKRLSKSIPAWTSSLANWYTRDVE